MIFSEAVIVTVWCVFVWLTSRWPTRQPIQGILRQACWGILCYACVSELLTALDVILLYYCPQWWFGGRKVCSWKYWPVQVVKNVFSNCVSPRRGRKEHVWPWPPEVSTPASHLFWLILQQPIPQAFIVGSEHPWAFSLCSSSALLMTW